MSTSVLSTPRRSNSLRLENDDYHLHIISPWMSHRRSNVYSDPIPPYRPSHSQRLSSYYVPPTNSDFPSSLPRCSVGKFRKDGERVIWNPYNGYSRYGYSYNVDSPIEHDPVTPTSIFSSHNTPSISSNPKVPSIPEQRLNFDISTVLKQAELASKPLASRRFWRRFSLVSPMRKTPEPRSSSLDEFASDTFMRSATEYQAPPPKPKKHRLLRRIRGRKHRGQMLSESAQIHSAPPPQGLHIQDYRRRSCCSAPPPSTDIHGNEYDRRNDRLYIKFMSDSSK